MLDNVTGLEVGKKVCQGSRSRVDIHKDLVATRLETLDVRIALGRIDREHRDIQFVYSHRKSA